MGKTSLLLKNRLEGAGRMFNSASCAFEFSSLLSRENRSQQLRDASCVLPWGFAYYLPV